MRRSDCHLSTGGCPRFVPHSTDPANPAKSHEPPNLPDRQTCRSAARCQTGTPFGAAQSIASRPKPGFRKEARLWAGKKARDEPTCVSHGIAPISPASRAAPGGCVPGVSDERPNLPKPKPPTPQSPCLQPRRSPRPGPRTLPRARFANRGGPALFYIWAGNPGNDFGGLSVAKNAKISKARLHTESFRIQCGLLCCATAWPFFV